MPDDTISVLFLGDVIGKPGRQAAAQYLSDIRADFKIINGENMAGGIGITPSVAIEMFDAGADGITTGNHIWKKKEIIPYVMAEPRVIRPLNYPPATPGFGSAILRKNNKAICIANIEGRTFMGTPDCPFRAMDEFFSKKTDTVPVIVDFHAEATSEKIAMGWYLDGRAACVVGTHTHVQTADETVLPKGTGYITDLGMTGPANSVIGMDKSAVLERFLSQMPQKYEVAKGDLQIQGVMIKIDVHTGHCLSIERIRERIA
jgi:2',3'-cyclic-nucleotide 2'-phosphodiesterase